jgi:hypothetical protein
MIVVVYWRAKVSEWASVFCNASAVAGKMKDVCRVVVVCIGRDACEMRSECSDMSAVNGFCRSKEGRHEPEGVDGACKGPATMHV